MRQRQTAQGLKRIEILTYPADEQAIRSLADSLRRARTAQIEAQSSSGYPSSNQTGIASI